MSKAEILAELPHLKVDELAEVQAKLDELSGETWIDNGELSASDKAALDEALLDFKKNPDDGISWDEALVRIKSVLHP